MTALEFNDKCSRCHTQRVSDRQTDRRNCISTSRWVPFMIESKPKHNDYCYMAQ